MKDGSNDFSRLMRDGGRHGDYTYDAPWSNGLYKAVVDATIWDPEG
jgi:hypothetical protein